MTFFTTALRRSEQHLADVFRRDLAVGVKNYANTRANLLDAIEKGQQIRKSLLAAIEKGHGAGYLTDLERDKMLREIGN